MSELIAEARRHGEISAGLTTETLCHEEPARLCGRAALGGAGFVRSLRVFYRTVRAALLEIFDESAYDRFLARSRSARSVASYRAFLREREAAFVRKPHCC